MKKINLFIFVCLIVLLIFVPTGCNKDDDISTTENENDKIDVITTIFPEYDFVRQIAGDLVNLSLLLPPGSESHSFDPTPQDIIQIQDSEMFVFVGGDSDEWVNHILEPMDQNSLKTVKLMDCVEVVEEELVEGMEEDVHEEHEEQEEHEEHELDEHVWTSPRNAILIVKKLRDELCEIDPRNAGSYKENAEVYIDKLKVLDQSFQEVVDHAARKVIIFGDRFPLRYFVEDYGISYYAAFPGCSTDTQASAATVAFLIDKIKEDKIPVVFHIELSNEQMCDSISDATGAKKELFHAVHNISKDDFEAGVTYLELMEKNVEVLEEALN
jgi:zinc transport system substrate-binding protein